MMDAIAAGIQKNGAELIGLGIESIYSSAVSADQQCMVAVLDDGTHQICTDDVFACRYGHIGKMDGCRNFGGGLKVTESALLQPDVQNMITAFADHSNVVSKKGIFVVSVMNIAPEGIRFPVVK